MTSTARPTRATRERTPRVLLAAVVCVVLAVALAVLAGGLLVGSSGALGALVGGGIATGFFVFGYVVVTSATRMAPQFALMVALLTYTLQIALVALVLVALASSDAVGRTLAEGWLAGGVVVATVAWTAGQMIASSRARVPAYDIELPGASRGPAEPPVPQREVGAP